MCYDRAQDPFLGLKNRGIEAAGLQPGGFFMGVLPSHPLWGRGSPFGDNFSKLQHFSASLLFLSMATE